MWGILSHAVLGLNEAVNLAWLVTFGIVLCLYELFDIESFGAVRGIAAGFALMALGASLCGWLFEFTGRATAISNLQDLVYLRLAAGVGCGGPPPGSPGVCAGPARPPAGGGSLEGGGGPAHPAVARLRRRVGDPGYRMEPTTGLEPVTCRLRIGCSTN